MLVSYLLLRQQQSAEKHGPKPSQLFRPWGREYAQCTELHSGGESQEEGHLSWISMHRTLGTTGFMAEVHKAKSRRSSFFPCEHRGFICWQTRL